MRDLGRCGSDPWPMNLCPWDDNASVASATRQLRRGQSDSHSPSLGAWKPVGVGWEQSMAEDSASVLLRTHKTDRPSTPMAGIGHTHWPCPTLLSFTNKPTAGGAGYVSSRFLNKRGSRTAEVASRTWLSGTQVSVQSFTGGGEASAGATLDGASRTHLPESNACTLSITCLPISAFRGVSRSSCFDTGELYSSLMLHLHQRQFTSSESCCGIYEKPRKEA